MALEFWNQKKIKEFWCTKVIFITWREKRNRKRYGDAVIDPAKAVAIPPMERC